MRIAVAQINPTLGDIESNKIKIIQNIKILVEKKSKLIVFPEASLFGYSPNDLLERKDLVQDQLKVLKEILKHIPKDVFALIGGFDFNTSKKGRPFFNTAFLCTKNKIIKRFNKELLPTGDVFDEGRFIEKGELKNNYFKIDNKQFFLTICEDIWAWDNSFDKSHLKKSWYKDNPLKTIPKKKTDLIINMSASPFFKGKFKQREHMAKATALHFKAPLIYVNMVGAQDELIYDGRSFLMNKSGKIINTMQSFQEDHNVYDLNDLTSWNRNYKAQSEIELVRQALVIGIRDFVAKNGFKQVHLGLSGGIDSALVATLAVDALGPQNVSLIALPTQFNLSESFSSAEQLAKNLNAPFQAISIEETFQKIKSVIDEAFKLEKFSLVHENLQARIRSLYLMAYSNANNSMLLTTGNKSEYATGYATLYGDMCGGLAALADLMKHEVYALSKLYNKETEIIPNFIIHRPPSAELRPNQKDQDSLPAYDKLDAAVMNIIELKKSAKSETEKWLIPMIMKSEFKRWQAPPVLKISEHAFGRGRRFPIAHRGRK